MIRRIRRRSFSLLFLALSLVRVYKEKITSGLDPGIYVGIIRSNSGIIKGVILCQLRCPGPTPSPDNVARKSAEASRHDVTDLDASGKSTCLLGAIVAWLSFSDPVRVLPEAKRHQEEPPPM